MHKTKDGQTLYMAGPNHQAFMNRHKEIQKEAEAYQNTTYLTRMNKVQQ